MAQQEIFRVPTVELINCLSDTIDLINPMLTDHHKRVGHIAYALACQIGLPEDSCLDLYFAGNLHDIGALSLTDRLKLLNFEDSQPQHHAETGALLLEMFEPLAHLGEMVRHHHVKWAYGTGNEHSQAVPLESHILHLADRIAVLVGAMDGINVLVKVPDINSRIKKLSGELFSPFLVEAFNDLSNKESFWLALACPGHKRSFEQFASLKKVNLDTDGILGMSHLFARIIDFRSHFTITHSSGVSVCAETLARLSGQSAGECEQMKIAGLLHDLGKLAVPAELLEKPAELGFDERLLIRCHTYFTRRALENVRLFETITEWGANHHERIDGKGYPYHVKGSDLSAGARIMAVADVFTAITEDRPYRAGMDKASVTQVICDMVSQRALDPDFVDLLMSNFEMLDCLRGDAQSEALREYRDINSKLKAPLI